MKKIIVLLALLCIAICCQAQWKVGGNFASASKDVLEAYNISWGLDSYYMFRNPDAFFKYGFNGSFLNIPGQEVLTSPGNITKYPNGVFIPFSFAVRFTLFGFFTLGPDVGVALSLNNALPSDFYFKGILGLDIANTIELNVFVSNVYQGDSAGFTSFGIGTLVHLY